MMAAKKAPITETQKTAAEEQIRALRKKLKIFGSPISLGKCMISKPIITRIKVKHSKL